MSNLNLIFFRMSPNVPLVKELAKHYKKDDSFNVEFINDDDQANQFLATAGQGIFLFEVKSKIDLQSSVSVLKGQRKLIKNGLIKPACILHVKNKKVEKILSKYGCIDLLDETIKAKTFSFKIDFWSRSLRTLLKKQEEDLELKTTSFAKAKGTNTKKEDFNLVKPLNLQSDIWLFKSKSDYKKILRRWLLRALGPSPHVGTWMELEPQPGDKLPTWKYVLRADNGQFILEEGAWFFSGSKPEFDWKINRWNFSSDAPHLYFYRADGQVFSRFKFENGVVDVAENSQFALTKEDLILETCDSKFNIEADEVHKEAASSIDGEDEDLAGSLEGKNSHQDKLGGPLAGKTQPLEKEKPLAKDEKTSRNDFQEDSQAGHYGGKAGTDQIGSNPLGGRLKNSDNEDASSHYGGKAGTDQLTDNPLGGRLKKDDTNKDSSTRKSQFSEDDQGGHLGGKAGTDDLDRSPLAGKLKQGEPSLNNNSSRSEFSEDDQGGHLGGKAGTDELDRGPLGGKLKPIQKDEKDNPRSEFSEDDQGGNLAGKSKTDEIDRSPLGSKLKPLEKEQKENPRSEFSEDDLGGHLEGKSSTNQLDRRPLEGKLKDNNESKKEGNRSDFSEDDLGGHLGGKSATDQLDRSPLEGKLKSIDKDPNSGKKDSLSQDPVAENLSGKSSTDNIPANPLSGALKQDEDNPNAKPQVDQIDELKREEQNNQDPLANQLSEILDDNPQLADELEKDLERSDLKAIDKDGNPVPLAQVAQMSIEELSRAGIDVMDKEGNIIPPAQVTAKIIEELSRDGIKALEKKGLTKKVIEKQEIKSTKTKMPSAIEKEQVTGKHSIDHLQSVEAKSGTEIWGDKKEKRKDDEALDDNVFQLRKNTKSREEKKPTKADSLAADMEEALGGGLSGDLDFLDEKEDEPDTSKVIGEEQSNKDQVPDLASIFEDTPDVDTESGDLRVVLKQQTKVGNNITFICEFEDFYEDELIVQAPKNSLPIGSEVKTRVTLLYSGKKIVVYAEGTVQEIEELSDKQETLIIALNSVDTALYSDFMSLYQKRQGSIQNFLQKAKGL